MSDFSDPAWWPTPPPKPPKAASTPKLVFGTLLPLVVVGAVVAAFVTHRSNSSTDTAGRSLTSFEACMKDQGADAPSASSNVRLLRLDAEACKDHLPKGIPVPTYAEPSGPSETARQAFQQCVQSALASLRGGSVRGVSSRQDIQRAVDFCRTVAAPGAGGARPGGPS